MLFALVVYSVGVSYYGHYTAQEQESPLDSGATNKAFFILGMLRSGNEYVAMVASSLLSKCVALAAHRPCNISTL